MSEITAPIPPRRRRRWRAALAAVAALGALALLVVLPPLWLAHTPGGTAWLLARLPGVEVQAPAGALVGDFAAERVTVTWPGRRVVADGVQWRGLRLRWPTHALAWLRIEVDALTVARVELQGAADAAPPQPPTSVALPVELEVRRIEIGALHAPALGSRPVEALRARLQLGADGGARHRVDDLALEWDRIALRGTLGIATRAPFDVAATLAAGPRGDADAPQPSGNADAARPGVDSNAARPRRDADPAPPRAATAATLPPFEITARAAGPLERLGVAATLRAEPRPGRATPSLDLAATVLPYARWPLAALSARTTALDLAALASDAPATAISGTAELDATALDQPARAAIALDNDAAGRWSDGRLPLRTLRAELHGRIDRRDEIELRILDAELGGAAQPGGRVRGSGRWAPDGATLALALDDVRPAALDARAPALRLGGPLELRASDLAAGSAQAALAAQARLRGVFERGATGADPGALQIELDAAATQRSVELRRAVVQAGAARATAAGRAERTNAGAWQLRGQATLAEFDPRLWWPGTAGSAWRDAVQRLNARLDADLLLPAHAVAAQPAPLAARAAGVRGTATLTLTDSVFAGVPVAGELALRTAGDADPAAVRLSLDAAGNRVAASGRLDRDARGAADHWDVDATLADLAKLAPLLRLAGSAVPAPAGALDLQATLDGRWPALRTQGRAQARQMRAGRAAVAQAAARWSLGDAGRSPFMRDSLAPIDVQIDLAEASWDARRIDTARIELRGSAAEHRLSVDAASPLRPPAWLETLHGDAAAAPAGAPGALAALQAHGALRWGAPGAPAGWRGRVERLELRSRAGGAAPWLAARDVGVELQFGDAAPRAEVAAGRAVLPGGMALRWSRLAWQGGPQPRIDLQAELEPIAAAPLMARLQPGFGWGGDLVVTGRVDVHSAPDFAADIEIGRHSGDLHVTDDAGTLPLGLTDLRLGLAAHDGVWRFTQGLAGASFGATAGAATLRTAPGHAWPPADAPLEGVFEARVANLAAWGAWLPAGWRLGGRMHATATLGGRFGAPELTGRIEGSDLAARNLLEGVELHGGVLDIALQGASARIVRAEAQAGGGRLRVEGSAEVGAEPLARLRLVAERAQVIGRVDRKIVASGDAALALRGDALRVDGLLRVDEGLIDLSRADAPSLGDDVTVLRGDSARDAAAQRGAERRRDVALDVRIDLGERLRLRGRGIDTALRGELRLTSPQGRLAVDGSIDAANGSFAAYGQKLDIERGIVAFNGPPANPRLDIVAVRPDTDVRVGVAISGSAAAPRVRLFSEPEMSETDKLSWLVLGRASEGLGRTDTAVLQRAALALIAGNDSEGPAANLTRIVGLDEMSVRQSDGTVPETIVTLGKQLSARWFVGYERGLNATTGTWQLIYRVARRFTLRAQSGLDNSLDAIWTWRWQ